MVHISTIKLLILKVYIVREEKKTLFTDASSSLDFLGKPFLLFKPQQSKLYFHFMNDSKITTKITKICTLFRNIFEISLPSTLNLFACEDKKTERKISSW